MLELEDPAAGGGGNAGGPPGAPTGGGVPKAGGGTGASACVNRIGAEVDDVELRFHQRHHETIDMLEVGHGVVVGQRGQRHRQRVAG